MLRVIRIMCHAKKLLLCLHALFFCSFGWAAVIPSLEIFSGSYYSLTNATNSVDRVHTVEIMRNTDNGSGNTAVSEPVKIYATISFSNSAHSDVVYYVSNNFLSINGQASSQAQSNMFTSSGNSPVGTGIDAAANYGVRLGFYDALDYAGPANKGDGYLTRMKIDFSSPLTNPLIHIAGNGFNSGAFIGLTYNFGEELSLVASSPAGASLNKISGTSGFSVTSNRIVPTLPIESSCAVASNPAGCGTIQVIGKNITSLTFDVYTRRIGMPDNPAGQSNHSGDAFVLSFSADTRTTAWRR